MQTVKMAKIHQLTTDFSMEYHILISRLTEHETKDSEKNSFIQNTAHTSTQLLDLSSNLVKGH